MSRSFNWNASLISNHNISLVKNIVEGFSGLPSFKDVQQWVLTSIKDPEVEVVSVTNKYMDLKTSLDGLKFGGGGDFPEQILKGGRNSFKTF